MGRDESGNGGMDFFQTMAVIYSDPDTTEEEKFMAGVRMMLKRYASHERSEAAKSGWEKRRVRLAKERSNDLHQ